jgi:hypothetical protein
LDWVLSGAFFRKEYREYGYGDDAQNNFNYGQSQQLRHQLPYGPYYPEAYHYADTDAAGDADSSRIQKTFQKASAEDFPEEYKSEGYTYSSSQKPSRSSQKMVMRHGSIGASQEDWFERSISRLHALVWRILGSIPPTLRDLITLVTIFFGLFFLV